MGLFDFIADDMEGIPEPAEDPPICDRCKQEDGKLVEGERAESWQPGFVIEVWKCPECGHETPRDNANERFV